MAAVRMPKTLGDCIDLLYTAQQARLEYQRAADKKLEELRSAEARIEEHIINAFETGTIEGAMGSLATARVQTKEYPSAKDWDKIYTYIHDEQAWELLERRISASAYRDRLASRGGVPLPGIESFKKKKLSLTKRGGGAVPADVAAPKGAARGQRKAGRTG